MTEMETEISKVLCDLNCWRTPTKIKRKIYRDLTVEEIKVVFETLEAFVPKKKWITVWRGLHPKKQEPVVKQS